MQLFSIYGDVSVEREQKQYGRLLHVPMRVNQHGANWTLHPLIFNLGKPLI
jgi:hypothetical protein